MGISNIKTQAIIESAFYAAVNKLKTNEFGSCFHDLYVQVDMENGEVSIYDEEEHLLEKVTVFDWVNKSESDEPFRMQVVSTLKAVLTVLVAKNAFDSPNLMKPFSVNLTGDDFSVIEELLFLDDDNLRIDDPLLKDLDADLDDFLARLFSDIK